MPALSSSASRGETIFPESTITYIILGVFFLTLLSILISRRRKSPQSLMKSSLQEKNLLTSRELINNSIIQAQSAPPFPEVAKPRIQRSPPPPPFTPQTDPIFSSFEAFEPSMELPPRRRSYTKILDDGTEVTGEIMVADGWRRHTKVFGGGVCKACEENERRMSA